MATSLVICRSNDCRVHTEGRSARGLRVVRVLGLLSSLFILGGSGEALAAPSTISTPAATATVESEDARMWMTVGERRFAINLADTEAARAFAAMLPLTLEMPDLNSNEKHAKLPKALPTSTIRPGTIYNGDLMLYGAQTLVVFYLTFDSRYSYTRLGRIEDPTALSRVLGRGIARITFSRD